MNNKPWFQSLKKNVMMIICTRAINSKRLRHFLCICFSLCCNSDEQVSLFTGYEENGESILAFTPTLTLQSSRVSGIHLAHDDLVDVTITCVNQIGLKNSSRVPPVRVLSVPPSSDMATIDIIPQTYAYFNPRNSSQAKCSEIEFRHAGFRDVHNIQHFQYMVSFADSHTDWITIGKLLCFNIE